MADIFESYFLRVTCFLSKINFLQSYMRFNYHILLLKHLLIYYFLELKK